MRQFFPVMILIMLWQGESPCHAQSTPSHTESKPSFPEVVHTAKTANTQKQMVEIHRSIESLNKELVAVKQQIKGTEDELELKQLNQERDKLAVRLEELQLSLEEVAIGGIDIEEFEARTPKRFNWQNDLKEIFRPILDELKHITERPRAIEKLRNEKNYLESRLPLANQALEKLGELRKAVDRPELHKELLAIEEHWRKRRDEIANQLKLVSYQLEEKLHPPEDPDASTLALVKEFLHGRGLTIFLAFGAFAGTYTLFYFVRRLTYRWSQKKRRNEEARLWARIVALAFRIVSIIAALLITALVLYVRGDWIIMGLLILFVLGLGWTIRQSLPRFVRETQLLLNLGPVREKERVVYNGLPWRVEELGYLTVLVNPALMGGILHLPTDIVMDLQSRRFAREEPWFPCKPGDFVQLDDNLFGSILRQTPEMVQMKVLGGSTKTYPITDFLGLNPRNLSHGFGVFVTFGLDNTHQNIVANKIPEAIQAHIMETLDNEPFAKQLLALEVNFKEARASSLDVLIIATFSGDAAEHYFAIGRFIQRTALNTCSVKSWRLPFTQVKLHMQTDDVSHMAAVVKPSRVDQGERVLRLQSAVPVENVQQINDDDGQAHPKG